VNVDSIKCNEILNTRPTGASQEGLSTPWVLFWTTSCSLNISKNKRIIGLFGPKHADSRKDALK
jgi:hypothetical protein